MATTLQNSKLRLVATYFQGYLFQRFLLLPFTPMHAVCIVGNSTVLRVRERAGANVVPPTPQALEVFGHLRAVGARQSAL